MRRGTVLWVNLGDAHPPEIGKTRPAVVVSNTEQNELLDTVVVVPMSSRPPAIWPLRIAAQQVGKLKRSFAIVPGIRQVDKRRLVGLEGVASDAFMKELSTALYAYLDD